MMKHNTAAFAAMAILAASPALASDEGKIDFEKEINACIAEIDDHADYNDATRVRHTVFEVKNTFAGYVLSISTGVYARNEKAIREYTSYCVAKGAAKPKRFTIDQVSG